jgi:hypothetical protein
MAKKSLKVIALTTALATAGSAYAQQYNFTQERINDTDKSVWMRTGDLIFDTDYRPDLDRARTTDMNTLIRGGNVTSIYAMDAIEALKSRINYLNTNPEANKYFTKDAKDLLIGRYNILINEISKESRSPNYKFCLDRLSNAVSDGIITPEELMGVEDGTYCFVKEGTDNGKGYAVFALMNLPRRIMTQPKEDYSKRIGELEGALNDERNKSSALESQLKARESAAPIKPAEKPKPVKTIKPARETSGFKPYWTLTAGANSNTAFDNLEANLGTRFYPTRGFGLGVSADVGFEKGRNLETYSEQLSSGRNVYGEINEKDIFSIGFSGEIIAGPFIIGGGVEKRNSIKDTVEKIKRYDEVLKANSNSASASEISGKAYAGFGIPIGKKFGLDVIGGYKFGKSNSGAFGGAKLNIKLGK